MHSIKLQKPLLSILAIFFLPSLIQAQPAGLVVNEVSQGSTAAREFAELVVVGPPCSTVDIRGWILDDNNGEFIDCVGPNTGALPGTGIAPGHVRFKFDPIWQNVPVGTIILVYAFDPGDPGAQAEIGALTPDYTDSNCDRLRVVPLNASNTFMEMDAAIPFGAASGCCPNGSNGNPSYAGAVYVPLNNQAFSGVTGKLGLRNEGDGFQVRDASANFFHGLSYGTTSTGGCVPQPLFDGGIYGLQFSASGPNLSYQFRNTLTDDYTNVANFGSFTASTTQSPGLPNNCDNAQWIGSLRRPPESIFQTSGAACAPNPMATSQSICVGQTLSLTLPNTNTCTSNTFAWSFSGSGSVVVQGSSTNSTVTIQATGAGTVNAQITATISNSLLYTQGGCSGPQFPQSLTYTFPLVISPGPSAFPTVISACNMGNGQALFNLTSVNNIVNGNTGQPVSWWQNMAATIPIANPAAYTSGPGTVWAVVTSGPCSSAPVAVTLVVLPVPVAFPATLVGCNQGNGQGAYNLTSLNNMVNGNTGLPVSYWLNAAATIPVPNPTNYIGGPGLVYATVLNGNCTSAPVPITLTVVPTPTTANTFITVNPLVACGTATVTVTFFFPSNNLYNISLQYGAQTFNGQNLATGATANFTISQNTQFVLTSVTLAQNSLCMVNFANPPILTVVVNDPPDLEVTGNTVICTGESIDLDTVVTETANPPGTIPITFHSGTPPNAGNAINSLVSPLVTTTYYVFANGGAGCQQTLPVTITVTSGGTPVLGSTTVCSDDPPLNLDLLLDPNFPAGTWAGPGVSGNFFDPTGLNGAQNLTFTPAGCGNPANTTVNVLPAGTPVLGMDTLCQADPLYDLTQLQDPNFPIGSWGGPGVSGNFFDPSGQSGPTPLVFTPQGFCALPAVANMFVVDLGVPVLLADTLCSSEAPLDLALLEDPAYPDGVWSGPGATDTLFDPSVFTADTLVTLTFTPSTYCTDTVSTTIWVQAVQTPVLGDATLCDIDPILDLTTLEDPNYPGGIWAGPGVIGGSFDPAGLGGAIELSYVFPGFCIDTAFTTIIVVPSGTPVLGSAEICEIDGLFDLAALQDPLYPSGVWTGPGVTGNVFDPAGQNGSVILTFTPAGSCANSADAAISVAASAQPVLSNATVCQSDGLLDLNGLQDPNFPLGTWSGSGVSGSNFDPAGQSGVVTVTFTPADTCFLSATASILVNQAPAISNLTELCDPNNTTYTVSFEINGGDPGSYTVNGVSATSPFVSAPIVSGDPYVFSVDDANGCGPVDVSGSVNCVCTTSSGTMDTGAGPIMICQGFSINATDYFDNDAVLDPNDLQQFALHDSPGPGLGNIVAISNTGFFVYPVNIVTFQSYYISVIAGNDDGTGNVDNDDPCFSASAGIEVIFTELSVDFSMDLLICETDCYGWALSFQGIPPFTFEYNISAGTFSQMDTVVVFQNDTTLAFCPVDYGLSNGFIELQPGDFSDALCSDPGSNLPPTIVTISPTPTFLLDPVLCPDEEIMVNGTVYNMGNPSGVEIIPLNLPIPDACDSIVTIQLSFFPPALGSIAQTLCEGESLVVNGTTYDAANPSGTETFTGGSVNGCDSTVTINLGFYPPASFNLVQTLCEGESIAVNGTVFDQANPLGVVVIPNGSYTGCDSTVTVALTFLPHSNSTISSTLCPGGFLTVNGTIYNQANPSGVEFLPNGNYLGCDSTINVTLNFFPPSIGIFSSTLCEGESLVINGTLYDENNPGGTELFAGGSYTGCDSTLQVSLSFVPNSVNNLSATLCPGESIVVNGVTYGQANPGGTEILPNGNAAGCDSTINVSLSFFPPASGVLSSILCAEDFLVINGTVYNSGNPSGTEVFPGGSANGCDSTLNIALSFLPPVEFLLIDTLVSGQFITVNGTIYNETNPSGTQVFFNGSFLGCDSTVNIQLFFEEFELEFSTLAPSCFGFQDGQFVIEGISGGKPPYSVSIDGIFFQPIDTFPFVWADLPAGSYQVTVQDANGDMYLINIVIPSKTQPLLDLGPDLELELGESAELEAGVNFPVAQINWLPSNWLDCDTCLLTTLIAPQTDITYTVTALDPDGCPATDFLSVRILKLRKLFIPSVFSPNADGANDLFVIYGGVEVSQIREFQVYNRWGSLMYRASNFQPNDPAYGWDGYFKDRLMDVGVYVYYAEVEFVDGVVEVLKGGVTLVR